MEDRTDRTGLTVAETASILDISREAVRKRIARGTLKAEKGQDGAWTVYLDQRDTKKLKGETESTKKGENVNPATQEQAKILVLEEALRNKGLEIERLERIIEQQAEESRRKDTILLNLTNKIPQLEAPEPERRPWWKKFFQ